MTGKNKFNVKNFMREKKLRKLLIIILLFVFLMLAILYYTMGIIYNSGNFSVTLDKNLYFDKGLIIYDDTKYKVYRSELYAPAPESFDNISYRWLPTDIDSYGGGSHNGENYMAYTFYVENTGTSVSDYWSELVIVDAFKNVDSAVRIRVYKNGEEITYAKPRPNGTSEPGTEPFKSSETIALEHVENFKPKDVDKYTVVMWIEGSDPDCTDNILGGEFKIAMNFNSEHMEEK